MPAIKTKPAEVGSPADLTAAIERHRHDEAAARTQLAAMTAARPAMLLDLSDGADAALEAHDLAIGKASRAVERAQAFQAKLAADLEAARAAEAERGRAARHAAAKKAGQDAEAWLRGEYPKLAAALRKGLERVAEAKALIGAANEHLPEGADLIADPEDFRGLPAKPTVRTRKKVTVYRDREGYVVSQGVRWSDSVVPPTSEAHIEEHQFVEPGEPAQRMPEIAGAVTLPALKLGEDEFWPPAPRLGPEGWHSALA